MTISLTFPDGAQREFPSGITGADIAKDRDPALPHRFHPGLGNLVAE